MTPYLQPSECAASGVADAAAAQVTAATLLIDEPQSRPEELI